MRRPLRILLMLLLALPMLAPQARGQGGGVELDNAKVPGFPVPFGPSNLGRDFWFVFPGNWDNPGAAQYYIRLYITSGVSTQVRVYVGGSFFKSVQTKALDIVTVDLNPLQAQVFTRRDVDPIPIDQNYRKKAVHVEADAPIVVYGINRTSFTSDGMLLLPTNGLGREYVVASYAAVADGAQQLPSQYVVVAPYDNTTVYIEHVSKTPNHSFGERFSVNMNEGDVYSAMTVGYGGDMSGVTISASKPVYVAGGQNCTYIPNLITYCCCDHLSETMLPVSTWGRFYHGVPFIGRKNGDFYRIFAAYDNTTVYVDGKQYGTLSRRGGEEGLGWLEYRATGPYPIEFSADKPIYVSQYNTSSAYDGVQTDPFYLVLTPIEQYQTGVTFATPGKDYPLNYVNFVCDSATWPQMEIAKGGTDDWMQLRSNSEATIAVPPKYYPSKVNGITWMSVTLELRPGTYRIRAPKPFAGYLYGFSSYDSYGYPLSVAVGNIETKDTIAPELITTQDCDGTVIAQTTDKPDDDNVRSNLSTIELDPLTSRNYRLVRPVTPKLEPGITISYNFRLEVIDRTQDAVAYYTITDQAGNVTKDTVTYTAFKVTVSSRQPENFGKVILGQTKTSFVTFRNLSNAPITLTEAKLKFGNRNFTLLSPTGSFTLGPAGSGTDTIDARVQFDASASGTYVDSIGIRDSCGLRWMAEVRGQVVTPIIKVSDRDFGRIPLGATVQGQITITNASTDDGDLVIYGGTGPFNNPVVFLTPNGLPQPMPLTIAAGGTQTFRVDFQPAAVEIYLDSIVFTHNAPPNPANDSVGVLKGEGILGTLLATSYIWPETRINTRAADAEVYLVNFGSAPVRVVGLRAGSPSGDVGDFQIIDPNVYQSADIQPGDTVTIPVGFQPTAIGPRQMSMEFETIPPQAEPVISTLEGIGVQGALRTMDYDFGTMEVDERDSVQDVLFWLPVKTYDDTVFIDRFTFTSDQGPGGNADFSFVDPGPVVLVPGVNDTLTIQGTFRARGAGVRRATLTAVSRHPLDQGLTVLTSNWTGIGTVTTTEFPETTSDSASICVGTTAPIRPTLSNAGTNPFTVTGLSLARGGVFTLTGPAAPFDIAPGSSATINLLYAPTLRGRQYDTVIVTTTMTGFPTIRIPVVGEAKGDTLKARIVMKGTSPDGKGILAEDVTATLVIDKLPPGLITGDYSVDFTFDRTKLKPRADQVKLDTANAAGASANVATGIGGVVQVNVTSPGPLRDTGAVVSLPFTVLFDDDLSRTVEATIRTSGGECMTLLIDSGAIDILPICGLSLRMIELTDANFALDQNKPNPFNPVTVIRYSVGLDGPTKMMLFDANGRYLQTLVDQEQKAGVYELTLDVTNLPSGNYYYKLVSSHWNETRMLTVVK